MNHPTDLRAEDPLHKTRELDKGVGGNVTLAGHVEEVGLREATDHEHADEDECEEAVEVVRDDKGGGHRVKERPDREGDAWCEGGEVKVPGRDGLPAVH